MTKKTPRTRSQLQDDALVIECLLNSVMAMAFHDDSDDTMRLLQMAHDRAEKMGHDLDQVNMGEVVA